MEYAGIQTVDERTRAVFCDSASDFFYLHQQMQLICFSRKMTNAAFK